MSELKVALTGARGFLGWHLRAALRELNTPAVLIPVGADFDAQQASEAMAGCSRVIHLAGVNRGTDAEIDEGNVLFARQFAEALLAAKVPPTTVVFANSIQADNGTVYGEAKARASEIVEQAAAQVGAQYADVRLPNLFGEHGRPFYNSVTATFCHLLATGGNPTVATDAELTLLHAQDAADLLVGATSPDDLEKLVHRETVSGLLVRLANIAKVYRSGEIPDVADPFERNLFNTFRSFTVGAWLPPTSTRHTDARGAFFEVVRSHGGTGQASFSTTVPGVARGDHFHRRKIERFTVVQGSARISLRRLFDDDVISFDVTGGEPVSVDMPTMWAHNITNTGADVLYTHFWTNDIFDPSNPDTIAEVV